MAQGGTDHGTITVFIIDGGLNEPKIYVDPDPLVISKKRNSTLVKNGRITWKLQDETTYKQATSGPRQNFRLACIDFEGDGVREFEEIRVSESGKTMWVTNKFVTKKIFKYTIWVVPQFGFGKPIKLDPMVKNDPD